MEIFNFSICAAVGLHFLKSFELSEFPGLIFFFFFFNLLILIIWTLLSLFYRCLNGSFVSILVLYLSFLDRAAVILQIILKGFKFSEFLTGGMLLVLVC
jgi:hypothetical protein